MNTSTVKNLNSASCIVCQTSIGTLEDRVLDGPFGQFNVTVHKDPCSIANSDVLMTDVPTIEHLKQVVDDGSARQLSDSKIAKSSRRKPTQFKCLPCGYDYTRQESYHNHLGSNSHKLAEFVKGHKNVRCATGDCPEHSDGRRTLVSLKATSIHLEKYHGATLDTSSSIEHNDDNSIAVKLEAREPLLIFETRALLKK